MVSVVGEAGSGLVMPREATKVPKLSYTVAEWAQVVWASPDQSREVAWRERPEAAMKAEGTEQC